jgi:glycosyltransferase involved in cell wall biosynthesis
MIEKFPLVSVIAICFNHEKYVIECLQSVVNQTYSNIELIIVDDFSKDKSREKILEFVKKNPLVRTVFNEKNIGNCRSFNQALKISTGKYIVDLATDDVLMPKKLEKQVKKMEETFSIGVIFSDADFIDSTSNFLGNCRKNLKLPIGNVYKDVLEGNCFTMPVSMMIRRTILELLNGYNGNLAYEDFDFWVRSSRICDFGYIPEMLAYQRILKGSHSTKNIIKNSPIVQSTVIVCQKAFALNETDLENKALSIRLRMVLLRCALTENFYAGKKVLILLDKTNGHNWKTFIGKVLIHLRIPLNSFFVLIMNLRRFLRFKI